MKASRQHCYLCKVKPVPPKKGNEYIPNKSLDDYDNKQVSRLIIWSITFFLPETMN